MKIASWNVNSLNVRLPHLQQWCAKENPDIIVLQETKTEDINFPDDILLNNGYRSVFSGQKSYNGVAILSKHSISDVQIGIPNFTDEQQRVIAATINGIRIINLYVVNGQEMGSDKYMYKMRWLNAVCTWIAEELKKHPELIVLGDFNIAPDNRDVPDPAIWNDEHIFTSAQERYALQQLYDLGLHDAFRLHCQDEKIFSWWDYRKGSFQRNHGLRIDLSLISTPLRSRCIAADIDREPRTWERPSDHAPIWLTLADK